MDSRDYAWVAGIITISEYLYRHQNHGPPGAAPVIPYHPFWLTPMAWFEYDVTVDVLGAYLLSSRLRTYQTLNASRTNGSAAQWVIRICSFGRLDTTGRGAWTARVQGRIINHAYDLCALWSATTRYAGCNCLKSGMSLETIPGSLLMRTGCRHPQWLPV